MARGLRRTNAQTQQPYVLPEGASFLVADAAVHAVLANTGGDVRPAVTAELHGRWNHGGEDTVVAVLTPDQARDFAEFFTAAADQADRDAQAWSLGPQD
jgi:hypothetical protein